jgi:hypothetical protein
VTCLQAWGNAGGQAGVLRVLSALRRDPDELLLLLLCFAFRATTSSHYFT